VAKAYPQVRSIGVLTSDHVIRAGLFERAFDPARYRIVHPGPACQVDDLMAAIYGPEGIKSGRLSGASIAHLRRACQDLANQGAELILPGFTEIPVVLEMLAEGPLRIVDCNQVYAQAAVDQAASLAPRACKVGIVGGVGPAATVDFIDKIVRNTSARRDQDHIKLVLEHNPQIPDRTASLVAGGVDPTIALYATCKKLEAADADLIAIPCNTAHAFVERIQPYLRIPILNMMFETVQHILRRHPGCGVVGLLATDGTLESGVYHEAVVKAGLRLVIPDAARQRMVMEAIYAPWGVKAGHTAGRAREDLIAAIAHLVRDQGAELIILGCTELPLLVAQTEGFPVAGQRVAIIDPTEILACKCVELARQGFMAPVTHAEQGAACEAGAQGQDLQQQFTHGGTDYAGDVDEHGRQRWHAADIGGNDHGEGDHGRTQERDHQG
jgi:aspartate racemase